MYCIVLTTTNDKNVADTIARQLVEADFAACVQIDNVTSFFKWDNKLFTEEEFRIMIKAKSEKYKGIENLIVKLHNYEIPQIIKLDITDGLPAYLKWLGRLVN